MTERDIVEVLRERAKEGMAFDMDLDHAADEIEALRIERDTYKVSADTLFERLRDVTKERDQWQGKWMALAQASLLVGTMRLGDDEQRVREEN